MYFHLAVFYIYEWFSMKYSLAKNFLVVTKVIMRPILRSRFVSSLFEKQIYSISYIYMYVYIYSNVRLNKETDFYFLTKIYFHHVPCLINVDI
jgi:hypothetical protein